MMSRALSKDLVALTVLALLMERPRHPYEMQRTIRERQKDFAAGDTRRIYHAVERLQKRGLIVSSEVAREGKRPERTVYEITEEGRAEFDLTLREMISLPANDYPVFTAAMAFLCYLSAEAAVQALLARVALLEGEVAQSKARADSLGQHLHRLSLLEAEYLRSIREAELAWVRSLVDDIRSGRLTWNAEELIKNPDLMFRPQRPQISLVSETAEPIKSQADA
jgi:DNA-binding PadR family transcriptional regulator